MVDAFTGWLEATQMTSTEAQSLISVLKSIFARFGDPELIISDNGPPFGSKEFEEFCI